MGAVIIDAGVFGDTARDLDCMFNNAAALAYLPIPAVMPRMKNDWLPR